MLYHVPKLQWHDFPVQLQQAFWAESGATLLLVLFCQHLLVYPNRVGWKKLGVTILLLCILPLLAYLTLICYAVFLLPVGKQHGPSLLLSLRTNTLPVWITYYLLWGEARNTALPVCISADEPDLFWIYLSTIACFFWTHVCVIHWCTPYSRIARLIRSCIDEEIDQFRTHGVYNFISNHWSRLNLSHVLAFCWIFKVILVVMLGPGMWSILPPGSDHSGLLEKQLANSSFLHNYLLPSHNRSTLGVLLARLYIGAVVHGSETWLMVFGAAAFFGGLGVILVHLLTQFIDPSGETVNHILLTGDVPADVRYWNVIDDPELAVHQNDVETAYMLSNVGWNCAVLFLLFAFQYDLPNLRLDERIQCTVYGMIIMLITSVHPIQGLIKSLLLQLGIPGRDVPWYTHIRPLSTCILLVSTCTGVLAFAFTPLTNPLVREDENGLQPVPSSSARLYNTRFNSFGLRRFRLFLCTGQLLLNVLGNLMEYGIYQRQLRQPDWTGFRRSFFWTKLVTHVADYLLSLLSFLTICWLTVYDSVGVCRILIICCYFHCILYPSTHRAYTWIHSKLYADRRLQQLSHPTDEQLSQLADSCPICRSEMDSDTAVLTLCGHIYHRTCLRQWMARKPSCPLCQADLFSTTVTDVRIWPPTMPNNTAEANEAVVGD